jgi:hypothetical protein
MKKKIFYVLFVLIVVGLVSCKKDKEDDPFSAPYSELTVEQNKENVEQEGVEFVGEIRDLQDADAIEVLIQMGELMSGGGEPMKRRAIAPFDAGSSLKSTEMPAKVLLESLKSTAEDPNSFSELWAEIKARYTWNFTTEEFDSTGSENALIIEFPGKEGDLTNTAVLTVNEFGAVEITDPVEWPEGIDPELLTSLHAELEYNSTVIASFDFDASYQSNGMPTEVTSTLTIADFVFKINIVHSPYSSASVTYNLKRNDNILFEVYFSAKGNWSEDNIEANAEGSPEEIVNSANAHLILLNLKVVGQVNVKAIATEAKALLEDEQLTQQAYVEGLVESINNNAKLIVIYIDSNTKIASAEAYSFYDEYWQEYCPNIRFVYADGSKVDGETYFKDELTGFFEELNDFIDELNADYDLNLEHVD